MTGALLAKNENNKITEQYIRIYVNAYELPSPNAKELTRLLRNICNDNGILSNPDECFGFMQEMPRKIEQFTLFD